MCCVWAVECSWYAKEGRVIIGERERSRWWGETGRQRAEAGLLASGMIVLLVVDVVGIQSRGMLVGVSVGEEGYSMTRTAVKAPVAIRKNRNTLGIR